jgi:glutamate racemase
MKVALLDSGIGGWSFLTKIEKRYPHHTYLYFADQKNCPYGNKSLKELEKIAEEWIVLFKEKKIDILVLACNTMTAWFKQKFQKELNIPVLGTTEGSEKQPLFDKKVALLATVKTVQSQWYQRLFPNTDLCQIGNTWLAKTIEEHFSLTKKEMEKLKQEIEEDAGNEWNKMILGCTHYPLVLNQIKMIWPEKTFIDPADTIVEELKHYLNVSEEVNGKIIMFTTGELELLKGQISSFFDIKKQNKISIVKI